MRYEYNYAIWLFWVLSIYQQIPGCRELWDVNETQGYRSMKLVKSFEQTKKKIGTRSC